MQHVSHLVSRIVIATLAGVLACIFTTGATMAIAADACAAAPKGAPPQGQHWYYRLERTTKKKCWYLGDAGRGVTRTADEKPARHLLEAVDTPPLPDPIKPTTRVSDDLDRKIADARAELPPNPPPSAPIRPSPFDAAVVAPPADKPLTLAQRWPMYAQASVEAPATSQAQTAPQPAPTTSAPIAATSAPPSTPAPVAVVQPPLSATPVPSRARQEAPLDMRAMVGALILATVFVAVAVRIIMSVTKRSASKRRRSDIWPDDTHHDDRRRTPPARRRFPQTDPRRQFHGDELEELLRHAAQRIRHITAR